MADARQCAVLPPLHSRGGLGWGQLVIFLATRRHPLPASPCPQGEEQSEARAALPRAVLPPLRSRGGLGWGQLVIFLATRRHPLPASPCLQGEEPSEARPHVPGSTRGANETDA